MLRIRTSLCWVGAVLLFSTAGCHEKPPDPPAGSSGESRAGSPERPGFGGDFSLTNQDGQTFHLQDVRGKVVLLFFGYTSCPDMCPTTMSRIVSALDRVGDKRSQVLTLFVLSLIHISEPTRLGMISYAV